MSYKNAKKILPKDVLELLQEYIDGEYIYIPRKAKCRNSWGKKTGIKQELSIRDDKIFKEYISEEKLTSLASKYFLCEKSIQRIICKKKKSI